LFFSKIALKGYLVAVDGYMNLQLANSEEYIDGALAGHLGEILIRCNNILYIRGKTYFFKQKTEHHCSPKD